MWWNRFSKTFTKIRLPLRCFIGKFLGFSKNYFLEYKSMSTLKNDHTIMWLKHILDPVNGNIMLQ